MLSRLEQAGKVPACGGLEVVQHRLREPAPGQLGRRAACCRGKAPAARAQQHRTARVQQHGLAAVFQRETTLGHQQDKAVFLAGFQRIGFSAQPQGRRSHLTSDLFAF